MTGTRANILLAHLLLGGLILFGFTGCAHSDRTATSEDSDDQIAIGYGTQSRSETTYSVSSLDSADIDHHGSRIEEMIAGRMPGVRVVQTVGGGFKVEIRGNGTLLGGGQPLYVIDGMPIQADERSGLVFINAADVASIDVLKGPAASMYGVRGANGVVIITMKR